MLDVMQLFLGGIGEFFSDMGFILRIFLLVAVIGFINQHVENKVLKTIVAIFMLYITIFVDWRVYGTIYLVYTILGLGASSIVVDYFFIGNMGGHEDPNQQQQQQMEQQAREQQAREQQAMRLGRM